MRRWADTAAAVMLSLAVLVAFGCAGDEPESKPDDIARLEAVARQLALQNGDPQAQGRVAFLTTRAAARRVLAARLDKAGDKQPTYLLRMYGNFGRKPSGRPVGHLLVGVVDAPTLAVVHAEVVEGELGPRGPNPDALGLPPLSLAQGVDAAPPDERTRVRLGAIARREASPGGGEVRTADVFSTNEQEASTALGNDANGNPDVPVYMVVMAGSFLYTGPRPSATPEPPRTPFLSVVVDARRLNLRSTAWRFRLPDTDRLGAPIHLVGWLPIWVTGPRGRAPSFDG